MSRRRAALLPAALAVATGLAGPLARPAAAYEIWIDLNTYVEGRQGGQGTAVSRTNAFAGADGVWLITANAYGDNNLSTSSPPFASGIATNTATGFTLGEWRQIVTNIAGPAAKIATEDNPALGYPGSGPHPNNQSYNDAVAIKGGTATDFTLTDFFQYNETGSTAPGTNGAAAPNTGTILSTAPGSGKTVNGVTYDTQVQTYAATHGGKIGYLTRAYYNSWVGAADAATADPLVSAGVMETVGLEGQRAADWINAITRPVYNGTTLVRPAKPAYVLLTTATYRNLPGLYYLKQYAPDAVASGRVKFVLNNDYATVATAGDGTDGYGFFGPGDTVQGQQQLLNALKTATPVETWQWKTAGTSNWAARGNWSVTPNTGTESTFRAGQPGPANKWDAAAFTSPALTGNVTVNVNTAGARALAVYFDGPASYTINGTNAITLAAYGTVGADGRVPIVSGSIPTGPSTDATAYRTNIVPIQVKGPGGHAINAPITLDATSAAGLLIDNQTAPGSGYNLFLDGTLTTAGLPIYAIGVGNSAIGGRIVGGSAITMDGTGALALGGQDSNVGVTLRANSGRSYLYALGSTYAVEAVLDIGADALVRNASATSSPNPFNAAYAGPNVTINGGGTLDLYGRGLNLTALAGTNGRVTNSGGPNAPVNATLTLGVGNQSGAFAGTIANGSFAGGPTAVLAIAKTGTGTQTLSGAGTFTGGVTINAGRVVAAHAAALGTGGVLVNGAGASAANTAGTLALAGNVTVANAVTLQGPRSDPAVSAAVPHVVNAGGNNTLGSNLTLSAAGGLGVLVRSDSGTLTLSGTLTNNNNPGYARPYILYGPGDGRITGTIDNGTGATAVTKQGPGTWSVSGTATYTGPTLVQGGTLRLGENAFAPVLTNAGGADVQAGSLVLDYAGGASPLARVKALLAQSYAAGFASPANRLRSTTAAGNRGLGYADTGSGVVIAVALYGDATLDGRVDFADFVALQSNFGRSDATFGQGDFDYNGTVNFADFVTLQSNFGQTLAGGPAAVGRLEYAAVMAISSAGQVPEPVALSLLGLAGAGLLRRRR